MVIKYGSYLSRCIQTLKITKTVQSKKSTIGIDFFGNSALYDCMMWVHNSTPRPFSS
jgi:hypothetical protein